MPRASSQPAAPPERASRSSPLQVVPAASIAGRDDPRHCPSRSSHHVADGSANVRPDIVDANDVGALDDREDGRGAEECRDGDGDRVGRNRVEVGKVAFADLLTSARVVELHHFHVERIVEVGDRRVVEREMAVLADAEAAQVERIAVQQLGVALTFG